MLKSLRRTLAGWIAPESRSIPDDVAASALFYAQQVGGSRTSGPAIGERNALTIPAVWSAVSCYANTIGSLGLNVSERDARGGRKPAPDHWAYDLLALRPNRKSTSMRLRQAAVGHMSTRGNSYLEIIWDARGREAKELHLMDPRDIDPVEEHGSVVYRQKSGGPDLPAEDVLHFAMFGWDGVKGYSPIEFNAMSLGVASKQREYQVGLFDNSAQASGHLEVTGRLNQTQKGELRDFWNAGHQGTQNAGNVGILDNGAKWVQTSFSPQDAELILGCRFSVEEVARIWNLPLWKLKLAEESGKDGEQQTIDFYQGSILPVLTAIEQELDLKLLGRIERIKYFVFHDVRSLLRGNLAAETAQEQADLSSGVASVNEIRIRRGVDPIDDPYADKHWIPTNNLTALEDMGKETPAPTTQPAVSKPDPEVQAREAIESARQATEATIRELLGPLPRMIRRQIRAESTRLPAEPTPPRRVDPVAEDLVGVIRSFDPLTGRSVDLRGRRIDGTEAEDPATEPPTETVPGTTPGEVIADDSDHPLEPDPIDP